MIPPPNPVDYSLAVLGIVFSEIALYLAWTQWGRAERRDMAKTVYTPLRTALNGWLDPSETFMDELRFMPGGRGMEPQVTREAATGQEWSRLKTQEPDLVARLPRRLVGYLDDAEEKLRRIGPLRAAARIVAENASNEAGTRLAAALGQKDGSTTVKLFAVLAGRTEHVEEIAADQLWLNGATLETYVPSRAEQHLPGSMPLVQVLVRGQEIGLEAAARDITDHAAKALDADSNAVRLKSLVLGLREDASRALRIVERRLGVPRRRRFRPRVSGTPASAAAGGTT